METRKLVGADYVMRSLGVSRASAYRIIRDLNNELESSGVRTLAGKVNLAFFEKRFFAIPEKENENNGCQSKQ